MHIIKPKKTKIIHFWFRYLWLITIKPTAFDLFYYWQSAVNFTGTKLCCIQQ